MTINIVPWHYNNFHLSRFTCLDI